MSVGTKKKEHKNSGREKKILEKLGKQHINKKLVLRWLLRKKKEAKENSGKSEKTLSEDI